MKTDPSEKPENQQAQPPTAADETVRCRQSPETPRPSKVACDPFEAILQAYAQDPERWDGLE